MEYLVMECGLSYAVVLDQDGRILKVPNLGYTVGQSLKDVVLLPERLAKHGASQAHCPLERVGSLPVPAPAGKLGLAVAHRNGADADQPRCAVER